MRIPRLRRETVGQLENEVWHDRLGWIETSSRWPMWAWALEALPFQ